jgi:organic radical activating enzyme
MEQFLTLQGEGAWTGASAWFIRLAGCDVGCHWCDVKESWEASSDQHIPIEEMVKAAIESRTDRVVITGGEPAMHDLGMLTRLLREAGLKIHMETSGAHPFSGTFDWICLSPKKFKAPRPEYYELAHELKVVVFNDSDFEWAEQHASACKPDVQLFLQPEWSRHERMSEKILAYIRENPRWRLSLQTHKYLGIR